ncbi:phosphatidylinositol mannoside acyltransferase [Rhodococcus sp. D2-41]|uniref:Phosphatidylinositol mannoside acyltransferase n=1 Tax=Speluncibacter jeojiensis TaxID=2710754 RepID=A0A9X4M3Z9_9ACTN|nr:phosphatidylinositol mannoside acyltransferase [Rhodococcus sp. D2-41]MDG3011358.1 phosphatidylinositol mannoside acyltransferase [Rhodococcus sp. D2-41]MDG3016630.1 phosphatidylinositol mannoside acyltransferase [Corynebacteriales bacterium D3-21]
MSLAGRLADAGYGAGWQLVRLLPESVATRLFDVGADLAASRGMGTDQLRRNYSRVLGVPPEAVPEELVREGLRSYARYWREAFRLPSMDVTEVKRKIDPLVAGTEYLDAAMAAGHGAVLALPHSGNWDMAGTWLVQTWGKFATVAERLEPESLFERFVEYRESLGFEVFPLSGGETPPFPALAERLRAGGIVCLLGERDLTAKGVPVQFFGEQTSMPAGPAKLARDTGAALLPVHCWFTDGGWGFSIDAPIDMAAGVESATQALADRYAANIAAHPADWHMLQPLWWQDLSESRRARLSGA